jgi:catechol 2,3-dioxygenase
MIALATILGKDSMSTALSSIPASTGVDRITYGAVHLDVTDAQRALAFWRDVVGLSELPNGDDGIALGAGGRALIVLHPGAQRPALPGHAGLYHVALHVPTGTELARVVGRFAARRVPQAPTDHVFSMATYVADADGISLEVTLETPERFRSFDIGPGYVRMVDDRGLTRHPTERLDTRPIVAEIESGLELDVPLPAGTFVGHVHLNVPDMDEGVRFYRDVIGFDEHMVMPSIGMADLSAGGRFPHRLAMNVWQGPGATQPPAGTAGLRRFELEVADAAAVDAVRARLDAEGTASTPLAGGLETADPAGNTLRVGIA